MAYNSITALIMPSQNYLSLSLDCCMHRKCLIHGSLPWHLALLAIQQFSKKKEKKKKVNEQICFKWKINILPIRLYVHQFYVHQNVHHNFMLIINLYSSQCQQYKIITITKVNIWVCNVKIWTKCFIYMHYLIPST